MKPRVLAIVGPTASGKTSLSIELAKRFDGEVISADSRQVYRGLDIGTGKVTHEEMGGIPHHLLDIADPEKTYTVADYVRDGRKVIDEIISRGKLPIVVGGTFLYIDALLGKISTPDVPPNEALRAELELLSNEELFVMLEDTDPERALTIDKDNKRRLIRAIEIVTAIGRVPLTQPEELYGVLTLGIEIPKEMLQSNIHTRLITRLDRGMAEEVKKLHENGLSYERLYELGLEYHYISLFIEGKISEEQMQREIETKSWQYAKRQMTWLKRNEKIVWVDPKNNEKNIELINAFVNVLI